MDYRRDFLTRSGRHHAAVEREGRPFPLSRDSYSKWQENIRAAQERSKGFSHGGGNYMLRMV